MQKLNSKLALVNMNINLYLAPLSFVIWQLAREHCPNNYILTEATGILSFATLTSIIFMMCYAATPAVPRDFRISKNVKIGFVDWFVLTFGGGFAFMLFISLLTRFVN